MPSLLHQLLRAQARFFIGYLRLVRLDRLGQVFDDALHRVERGHRILENHADLSAAQLAHLAVR